MKKFVIILFISLSLVSCEKLLMPDPVGATPTEVFENLWKTIDEGYVYFGYNNVDWDSVHKEYSLKIVDTMEEKALFDTCANMLKELRDPTVILKSSLSESGYWDPKPYKQNFNRFLLERNYWQNAEKTGPFIHTVIDSIGYVYYGDFSEEVTNAQLDVIIESLRLENDSIQGVIFDIRDNPGGDINNVFTLMKRMGVDTTFKLTAIMYKAYYKNGPEHDDITEPKTSFIEQIDKTKFPKQFIMLTNRGTQGEAALFAAASRGFPNVRIWGDTTGGATSRIVGAELPNGWLVDYPASYFKTDNDRLIDDGLIPDKLVHMSQNDEDNGKDSILEDALNTLENE